MCRSPRARAAAMDVDSLRLERFSAELRAAAPAR
jgi:hypothetical protein